MVTKSEIKKLFPTSKDSLVDAIIDNWDVAEDAGINSPRRVRQFFANIGVETGGLTSVEESLNYTVSGLLSTFSRVRISEADAKRLGRAGSRKADQVGIANLVYGGAWGKKNLGNTQPNDGWNMRGGGMLQTTGRDNYTALGFGDNPQALRDPVTAFRTAVSEWVKRGCNELADDDRTTDLRKSINGGTNGLDQVNAYLIAAKKIWPDGSVVSSASAPATKPIAVDVGVTSSIEEDIYDGKPHDAVGSVQQKLDDLGYHEVGTIDKKWGSRTAGAITTFQTDNGLAINPKIDDTLLAALMVAPHRVIAPARANATIDDLRKEDAPEIKQTDQTKLVSQGLIGVSGLAAGKQALDVFKGTSDTVAGIVNTIQPIWGFLADNVWLIGGAVGVFFLWKSGVLQKIRLAKHQSGEDVSA